MRIWECSDCGAKIKTRFEPPEYCECENTKNFKLVDSNDKCEICGNPNKKVLVKHHILPKASQDNNSEDNLMLLCANCHTELHEELKDITVKYTLEKAKFRETLPEPPKPLPLEGRIRKENERFEALMSAASNQRSEIHILLEIIETLEKEIGKPVPIEKIIEKAKEQGIEEGDTKELFKRLKVEGSIFEPRINFIERIR